MMFMRVRKRSTRLGRSCPGVELQLASRPALKSSPAGAKLSRLIDTTTLDVVVAAIVVVTKDHHLSFAKGSTSLITENKGYY